MHAGSNDASFAALLEKDKDFEQKRRYVKCACTLLLVQTMKVIASSLYMHFITTPIILLPTQK